RSRGRRWRGANRSLLPRHATALAASARRRRAVSFDRCLSRLRPGIRDDPGRSRGLDRRAAVLGLPAKLRGRTDGQRGGGLDRGLSTQPRRVDRLRSRGRIRSLARAPLSRLREFRAELWIGVALCVGFSLTPYLWFVSTSL